MSWVYLLDKLDDLHEYVQKISVEYSRTKRTLPIIGIDSSFDTEATKTILSLLNVRHDHEDSACIRLDDPDPAISIHQPAQMNMHKMVMLNLSSSTFVNPRTSVLRLALVIALSGGMPFCMLTEFAV